MAGQHFQKQSQVLCGTADRPDLIQAAGIGDQSKSADAAVGGFQSCDAAEREPADGWSRRLSVPKAAGAMPAATAAAEPPLEPPGTRVGSHGLRVKRKAENSFDPPMPNSSRLVLPKRMAPAARSRETTVAS